MGPGVTVSADDAEMAFAVATIEAVPAKTAVTNPEGETVATAGAVDDHVTGEPAGVIDASNCRVSPSARRAETGLTEMDGAGSPPVVG